MKEDVILEESFEMNWLEELFREETHSVTMSMERLHREIRTEFAHRHFKDHNVSKNVVAPKVVAFGHVESADALAEINPSGSQSLSGRANSAEPLSPKHILSESNTKSSKSLPTCGHSNSDLPQSYNSNRTYSANSSKLMSWFNDVLARSNKKKRPDGSCSAKIDAAVRSRYFEIFFAALIAANTATMAVEAQINGCSLGYQLSYHRYGRDSFEFAEDAKPFFEVLDLFFGIAFLVEVLLRVKCYRLYFLFTRKSTCKRIAWWNLFDASLVVSWSIEKLTHELEFGFDPSILRVIRLVRLMRLLRLLRQFKGMSPLFLMMQTIKGSMAVLFWAFMLLFALQILFAFCINQTLVNYYFDDLDHMPNKRQVFEYFGTFSRSMFTMFEITLGNWPPAARILMEEVTEWFAIFSVLHKMSVGFAVIGVINGIFTRETFNVAACDDNIMLMHKELEMKVHTRKMQAFFRQADESADGKVDLGELKKILQFPQVRLWLSAQALDTSDVENLFMLMNTDQDDGLTAEELVAGVQRLKGPAQKVDVAVLSRKHATFADSTVASLENICHHVEFLENLVDDACQKWKSYGCETMHRSRFESSI